MKRRMGILTAFAVLILQTGIYAKEAVPIEWDQEFDVPQIADEIEALSGGIEETESGSREEKVEELYRLLQKDAALASYEAESLEERYDPRLTGQAVPVRNQTANTCWAFSSLAAGEQSLVSKGLADPASIDLSEAHLSYFFYHSTEDPLGNTRGDGNQNISAQDFLSVGSNTIFSTFLLAGWVGAAEEKTVPFFELTEETVYDGELAYADAAHLQNAYWINFKDIDGVGVIKQMIQKYGAAAINFYWNNRYYEKDSFAYYFPLNSSQPNNHSAVIVGWDDTFSKENFNEGCRPESDGAWIVKNSYGEDWGDGGYFYLSYEDGAVNSGNTSTNRARAYIFDFESADNYDYNYQYDGSAGAYNATNRDSEWTKVDSKGAIANVFTVQNRDGFSSELLKAVSFALFDTAVSYRIQIYKNLMDATDPVSGTPQLAVPVSGSTSYAGYYTVQLPSPVELKNGENFSVVVALEKESGGQVDFFVDKTYQNGNWVMFTNEVKEGESFRFFGGKWEDLAAGGCTARIKAFTEADKKEPWQWKPKDNMELSGEPLERSGELVSWEEAKERPSDATGVRTDGMSAASPIKSAATSDTSDLGMFFWTAVFFTGLFLIQKGCRKD